MLNQHQKSRRKFLKITGIAVAYTQLLLMDPYWMFLF